MDVRKYLDLKDVKTDSEAYIPGSENVDPTFVYSFYLNICKERFKIFDKGERKLAFRESKDPLIKKQGCQIHLDNTTGDEKNCIICNKLVNSNFIVCTKSDCNYKTHLDCLKQVETINDCKTDLLTYSCSSSLIKSVEKSKLVSLSKGCKIFVRKVRDNENHNRCIFCRKLAKNKLDLSCCTEKDCSYGIHSHCLKFVLYKKNSSLSSTNTPLFSLSNFKCAWIHDFKLQIGKSIKRGNVYRNEHDYCAKCETFVSIYEKDHLISKCKGFITKPIVKRLKTPWKNIDYMDRVFEYTKVEKCNFKVA